jgi:hypothetical protein
MCLQVYISGGQFESVGITEAEGTVDHQVAAEKPVRGPAKDGPVLFIAHEQQYARHDQHTGGQEAGYQDEQAPRPDQENTNIIHLLSI